jgi:sortase (surface protein transpeptidase)
MAFGTALVLIYVVPRVHSVVSSHLELHHFWRAHLARSDSRTPVDPDMHLWSKQRVAAYRESLKSQAPLPLGVLKIPSIGLEVPVLRGTDDLALNRVVTPKGHQTQEALAISALPGIAMVFSAASKTFTLETSSS